MGLRYGWKSDETKQSVWREDSALGEVPKAALEAWSKDPRPEHLLPFAKPGQTPDTITYRTLTTDEAAYCEAAVSAKDEFNGGRAWLRAFRIATRFPSGPNKVTESNGVVHDDMVALEDGHYMLAEGFTRALVYQHPTIAIFYGSRILGGARMSEDEKKALLPPSTPTPSSEVSPGPTANGSSKGDTAVLGELVAAVA